MVVTLSKEGANVNDKVKRETKAKKKKKKKTKSKRVKGGIEPLGFSNSPTDLKSALQNH